MNISSPKCRACGQDFSYDFTTHIVDPITREFFCNECYEKETYVFREECKSDAYKYVKHLARRLEGPKKYQYLVTFTWNNSIPHEAWLAALKCALGFKFIIEFKCFIEHPESNIHCHALITTSERITQRKFSTFNKKAGHVDIKRVKKDNGVINYGVGSNIFESIDQIKI